MTNTDFYKEKTMKTTDTGQALQASYNIGEYEKLRCQNKINKLMNILSGNAIFKTTNDVYLFLAEIGFETTDVNSWSRSITMTLGRVSVAITDLDERNYTVESRIINYE